MMRYIITKWEAHKLRKLNNAPFFSLNGRKMQCKIVHVYDGDTVHGIVFMKGSPVKFKMRMMGYDSPEMKPPLKQENREEEKKAAIEARDAISELILNKIVTVHFFEFDKYGRPLVDVYVKQNKATTKINDWMVENGHGYHYQGGTKRRFS